MGAMSDQLPAFRWPGDTPPPMTRVRQRFDDDELADAGGVAEREALAALDRCHRLPAPGSSVAVGVGSRGIDRLAEVVAGTVRALRGRGLDPFIVPAMGSHGGATAEGQRELLAGYGVTEEGVGAPIRAGMESNPVTTLDGTTLYTDALAADADAIVLINRVKPHTDFKGPIESGLVKMAVIGLGNQRGAASVHARGFAQFADFLPRAAEALLARLPVLFGVAMVENAYDRLVVVEGIDAREWTAREPALLALAKQRMGSLLLTDLDLLVIDEIGKNISGAGMDPNVTGRPAAALPGFPPPAAQRIAVLGLTAATHGNATGIGMADVITRACLDQIDFHATYINGATSRTPEAARIPLVAAGVADAVRLGVDTSRRLDLASARIVRITDTLSLSEIAVSPACLADVAGYDRLSVTQDAPVAW